MLTWQQYARFFCAGLTRYDIALLNMACAMGLPGTESMQVDLCLRRLEEWTEKVRSHTVNSLPRFRRRPQDYQRSEAYFRVLCLITVLQRDCGVRYNLDKIPEDVPFEPADGFLFGLLQTGQGTCANLPVLYVAVGRRLGYPLKLVLTRGRGVKMPNQTDVAKLHVFVRWDDLAGEQFNIEATIRGLTCLSDDYYRTGRYCVTPFMERVGGLLQSQTPRQELAGFLGERAYFFRNQGNYRQAAESRAWASALAPENAVYLDMLIYVLKDWESKLKSLMPQGFPKTALEVPRRRFPANLPLEFELAVLGCEAWENMLRDPELEGKWWRPLREGKRLVQKPVQALARFEEQKCDISFKFASGRMRL
jgi:hypothetical protein